MILMLRRNPYLTYVYGENPVPDKHNPNIHVPNLDSLQHQLTIPWGKYPYSEKLTNIVDSLISFVCAFLLFCALVFHSLVFYLYHTSFISLAPSIFRNLKSVLMKLQLELGLKMILMILSLNTTS